MPYDAAACRLLGSATTITEAFPDTARPLALRSQHCNSVLLFRQNTRGVFAMTDELLLNFMSMKLEFWTARRASRWTRHDTFGSFSSDPGPFHACHLASIAG
jgi:hypothetical protein